MQDLQAFPKSALCPSTGVTLMGQRRMQVKRLIIQPVGNQLLLFKRKIKNKKKQKCLKVTNNIELRLQPVCELEYASHKIRAY